jgi:integrase
MTTTHAGVGIDLDAITTALRSPTYQLMTHLVRCGLRPGELTGLYRDQIRVHRGAGEVLVIDDTDPARNRIVPLDPATITTARRWIRLINPDPARPLFPARWHPGWRTALARAGRRHGHTHLTPETIHRAATPAPAPSPSLVLSPAVAAVMAG